MTNDEMTPITPDQQQMLEAAAKSVAAKLQTFQDGLTADEQQVLGLAFGAVAGSRAGEDVAGYVWKDGVGEVREWCLTWQWSWPGYGPMRPIPRPSDPIIS